MELDWSFFNATVADRVFVNPPFNNGENQAVFPLYQQTHIIQVPLDGSALSTDTGTLLLGTATSLTRLNESLPEMAHWLTNTGTKLLVVLRDQSPKEEEMRAVINRAEDLGIAVFLISDSSMTGEAESNFGLAEHLYTHVHYSTRWIGVIDDDTFFPSLHRILEALTPYDPTMPWYVGGLTERHLGISTEGSKAWGGACIFLSVPLLNLLAENHDTYISMSRTWGDELWRDCIFNITSSTVHLTRLEGLHQLDMFGDLSGWYESGMATTPLSLHHWKSWHYFDVPSAHLVTNITGVDALFQRYNATDNAVFTDGYSIVQYPNGLPDMGLVEGTMFPYPGAKMPDAAGELQDSLGKLRPALEEGREKISWRFVTAVSMGSACVRQFYVRGASAGQSVDSVIEVD
ncbi:hypothetical protein D6D19_07261 [Aureobasidium pullulans]|uniref:Glycosyltransferase family 31 protein n=1 Tax=Aureobasidium pullulans TaxID=5580 RepID=A0A4S8ZYL6_AURPU|nr:hypothetical protein D6D19_07261 [Aureobasidium pullulans]